MLVDDIMDRARSRLVVIDAGASISDAALLMLTPDTDLVVVSDGEVAVGVITKRDIVGMIASGQFNHEALLSEFMSREIVSCSTKDRLLEAWSAMSDHRFARVPVLDEHRRPVGVIYARDALQALLRNAEHEEEVLRAYVEGVGYH